jgi:hypothetical protein
MVHGNGCWGKSEHDQITKYVCDNLWRYIRKYSNEKENVDIIYELTKLELQDLQNLAEIRFILSKELSEFICHSALKIINRLSKTSQYETIVHRDKLHGRIDWQKTIAYRSGYGNSKNIYAVVMRNQLYDLPENRLFLFILKEIQAICRKYLMYSSSENIDLSEDLNRDREWTQTARFLEFRIERLLSNPFVKQIVTLKTIDENIIELTKNNRNQLYRNLAHIAELLLSTKHTPIKYLNVELKGQILQPLNYDTLFEIAVLFNLLDTAKLNGWIEEKIGLIGGKSKFSSILTKEDMSFEIFTQTLPEIFQKISLYGSILDLYGLGSTLRRPDIIVKISNSKSSKFIIIEVKRSEDRKYLVDGAYKLLGYLKDFSVLDDENISLFGILVGWDGIKKIDLLGEQEILLSTWENFGKAVTPMLSLN